jgi:hypothetical protein
VQWVIYSTIWVAEPQRNKIFETIGTWIPPKIQSWPDLLAHPVETLQRFVATLEEYANRLALAQGIFASIRDRDFHRFCQKQAGHVFNTQILSDLGASVSMPNGPSGSLSKMNWLEVGLSCSRPITRLYALANLLSDPIQSHQAKQIDVLRSLAADLNFLGAHASAARVWTEILGATALRLSDYTVLRSRLQVVSADETDRIGIACELSRHLWAAGRGREAVTVLFACAGIDPDRARDREWLAAQVRFFTGGVSEEARVRFAFALSEALQWDNQFDCALLMIEIAFEPYSLRELDREYICTDILEMLRRQGDIGSHYISELAYLLGLSGRLKAGVNLIERFLGLADYHSLDHIDQCIVYLRTVASPDHAAACVSTLGNLLTRDHRDGDAECLLMRYAGINDRDFEELSYFVLRNKLEAFRGTLGPNTGVTYITVLADALKNRHIGQEWWGTTRLLRAYAGITPRSISAMPDPALFTHLRAFSDTIHPDNAANFVHLLAQSEGVNGQHAVAAAWLQGWIGIEDDDLKFSRRLRDRVDDFRHPADTSRMIQPRSFLLLMNALVVQRFAAGGEWGGRGAQEAAADLVEIVGFDWLWGDTSALQLQGISGLVEVWLSRRGMRDQELSLRVCREMVRLVREKLGDPAVPGEERKRSLWRLRAIRHLVVRVGHFWLGRAMTESAPQTDALRVEVLCWDAELGQRVLLERLGQVLITENAQPTVCALPQKGRPSCPSPPTDLANARFGAFGYRRFTSPPVLNESLLDQSGLALVPSNENRWERGVGQDDIAAAIGDTLLLRAGFDLEGRLVWSLFGVKDGRLQVLESRCLDRLAAGVTPRDRFLDSHTRHQAAIGSAFEKAGEVAVGERWRHANQAFSRGHTLVGGAVRRFQGALERAASWDDLQGYWSNLLYTLVEADEDRAHPSRKSWPDQDLIRYLAPTDLPDNALLAAYLYRSLPELLGADPGERGPLLARWADLTRRPDSERVTLAYRCVDTATEEFLREMEELWDLTPAVASLDAEATDLLVQVDDALHPIPIAFLKVGGKFLFERVRSVQAVLSPLVNDWLSRVAPAGVSAVGRLLTVSWVEEDNRARDGARLLHHLQGTLAAARGAEWYSASEEPAGRHAVLAAAMSTGPFAVVTVCGHGVELSAVDEGESEPRGGYTAHAGVALQDGIWTGSVVVAPDGTSRPACDLGSTELLIQVSCSLGRVAQSELRDAEGFCLELAVRRARSVVAGLWDLHSFQSPVFANWIAEEYLMLRDRATAAIPVALRGRALNQAHRRWLQANERGGTRIGLSTAAAFQLFGLP